MSCSIFKVITYTYVSFYSLTDVPTVSCSEMVESFTRLLDEADEYDTIHDIILQVNYNFYTSQNAFIIGYIVENVYTLFLNLTLRPSF